MSTAEREGDAGNDNRQWSASCSANLTVGMMPQSLGVKRSKQSRSTRNREHFATLPVAFSKGPVAPSSFCLSSFPCIHFCVFDWQEHWTQEPCEKRWAEQLDAPTDKLQLVKNGQWPIICSCVSDSQGSSTGLFIGCGNVSLEGWILSCCADMFSDVSYSRALGKDWEGLFLQASQCIQQGWWKRRLSPFELLCGQRTTPLKVISWQLASCLQGMISPIAWVSVWQGILCNFQGDKNYIRFALWRMAVVCCGDQFWVVSMKKQELVDLRNGTSILCKARRAWLNA